MWLAMGIVVAVPLLFVSTAFSARFTSTSYIIDASVNNSFGGQGSSSSYKVTTSGGESIVGDGSGGSYKMGAGYIPQLDRGMRLTVQPGGLSAYYGFDEAGGSTIFDGSSNTNNGQIGTGGGRTTGKIGSGLLVNGGTTDAQVPDNAALPTGGAMTVMLWVKQVAPAANEALISQWDYTGAQPVSGAWALQTANDDATKLRFFVADAEGDFGNNYVDTYTNSWIAGTWHHVAIAYDGAKAAASRVLIFIDGVQQATTSTGTVSSNILNANAFLDIGDFHGLDRQLHGTIDEVKLYKRTLSAVEIKAEYDAQNAGNPTGVHLGTVLGGVSNTIPYDAIVQADGSNYSLTVSQDHDLTSGANTIPAVSGSIASPLSWTEGTTKGLGFTIYGTNATAIPAKWNSGAAYAAFPNSPTSFYTRTGYSAGTKDYVNMRMRLDVPATQAVASYQNTITLTGTILP